MRPIFRLSLILLALFLAIAPAMTLAQSAGTSGSSTTTTTTQQQPNGGSTTVTAPNNGSSTSTDKTTTTETTTNTVPWVWIAVGAIVLIAIVGLVAANNRSDTTRIVS
jgi:beta-lactamase regulating signal transducer with metallopeptidase domain